MKNLTNNFFIIILLVLFAGCATTLPSSEPSTEMLKQADTIMLVVDESKEKAFQNFTSHLISKGFGIKNANKDLMLINTNHQLYEPAMLTSYNLRLSANVQSYQEETVINITGIVNYGLNFDAEVQNRGMKGSVIKYGFQKMNEIAVEYPHKRVLYKRN